MQKTICISADDYGLTRGITDSILQTADSGVLTQVSILANGYAVEYALEEWEKRKHTLTLSLHVNLTEGKALSNPNDVPLLVHPDGTFRRSAARLLLVSLAMTPSTRARLRAQILREVGAQAAYVRARAGTASLAVDGHQHVHMVPLVFDVLVQMHATHPWQCVRVPREPLYMVFEDFDLLERGGRLLAWMMLIPLTYRARRVARKTNIPYPNFFLGFLYSGRMTLKNCTAGLRSIVARRPGAYVEIGIHPGSARRGELEEWRGDVAWHYSPWRAREHALLKSPACKELVDSYSEGTLSGKDTLAKVLRYGIAGTTAALVHLAGLYFFVQYMGVWYVPANIFAFGFSFAVSFLLQKVWTFGDRSRQGIHLQAGLFLLIQLGSLFINTSGLYALVTFTGMWYLAAEFLILLIIAVLNFLIFNFFLFKRS